MSAIPLRAHCPRCNQAYTYADTADFKAAMAARPQCPTCGESRCQQGIYQYPTTRPAQVKETKP